jgi:alpha-1,2-mannosyltransferase
MKLEVGRAVGVSTVVAGAVLAMSEPVRSNLAFGQVNLCLAILILWDLTRPRDQWTGIAIGLATAIKLTPGLFIVYLLIRGRRSDVKRASLAFAAATIVTAMIAPAESLRYWTHELVGSGVGNFASANNNSIYGMLSRTVPAQHVFALWAGLALIAALIGLSAARRLSNDGREIAAVGAVGITACVMSPVAWDHHWVWCIPWLLGLLQTTDRRGWSSGNIAVWCAIAVFAGRDVLRPVADVLPDPLHFVVVNAFVIVAVVAAVLSYVSRASADDLALPEAATAPV